MNHIHPDKRKENNMISVSGISLFDRQMWFDRRTINVQMEFVQVTLSALDVLHDNLAIESVLNHKSPTT